MPLDLEASLISICARELGLTRSEILAMAVTAPKRYKRYPIEKRSGGTRIICQPSRELKAIQYVFLKKILADCAVHTAATAYQKGASIRDNAAVHRHSRVLLKLDFQSFFNSILVNHWVEFARKNFPSWTVLDVEFASRILFWGDGGYQPKCLSIGAPTSPHVSNIMMYRFDALLESYANQYELIYTRYADDITISSGGYIDQVAVTAAVVEAVMSSDVPTLSLNIEKTYLATKARTRRVTGLVLTNDGRVSLGRDRKRLISAMLNRFRHGLLAGEELSHLRGLLAFASDAEPTFFQTLERKYGGDLIAYLMNGNRP